MSSRDALARLVWEAVDACAQWRWQYEVAAAVGITEKHLSQMAHGKVGMSLAMADRLLAACGRRLVLATEPITEIEEVDQR
jgi:transcriptional regulator with XRE-family HTH domain